MLNKLGMNIERELNEYLTMRGDRLIAQLYQTRATDYFLQFFLAGLAFIG